MLEKQYFSVIITEEGKPSKAVDIAKEKLSINLWQE